MADHGSVLLLAMLMNPETEFYRRATGGVNVRYSDGMIVELSRESSEQLEYIRNKIPSDIRSDDELLIESRMRGEEEDYDEYLRDLKKRS